MNYFTKEHEMFRDSLRDFLNKEVKDNIDKWESDQKIPKDIWKKMGDQGFLGLTYPEKYGGFELDFFFEVILFEEMSKMNSGGFEMHSNKQNAIDVIEARSNPSNLL